VEFRPATKSAFLLADGDTDGITVRAGEVFFFFRCFGVGVGKDFFGDAITARSNEKLF